MPTDQHHDPGFARLRSLLKSHPGAFDHVKQASFDYDERKLPERSFAWAVKRLFPVHNAKQAALSYLYAKDDPKVPSEVKHAIKEALDLYEVPMELFTPAVEKTASAEPEECLFPESRTYPVRNAEEVKFAEENLLKQLPRMTSAERATAFMKLSEKAASYGVSLDPMSRRLSGQTQTDSVRLIQSLQARAGAAKTAAHQEAYLKIAESIKRSPWELVDRGVQIKMAAAIDELDQQADLVGYYDRKMSDPVTTVFNTEKNAERMIDLGGRPVAESTLVGAGVGFYKDALGDDFLEDITTGGQLDPEKLSTVIETLPLDMKRILARQLGA